MKKITCSITLSLLLVTSYAQNDTLDLRKFNVIPSTIAASDKRVGLDTLATSNPAVKLVFYADRTWQLIKDYTASEADTVMTEYWVPDKVQPYTSTYEQLPFRVTMCLVDSLETYCCPCQVPVYSKFGVRHGRNHNGVDLPSPVGTPVYSAFAGKVRASLYCKGYGNLVIVRHPNGLETYYGHLSQRSVAVGDWVKAGQAVGLMGSTGRSTGPHLHFECRYKGFAFDPQWIIDFKTGDLRMDVFILKKKFLSTASRFTPESIEDEEFIMKSEEEERAELARIEAERRAMRYHTIKSGDTLSAIARKNGKTVSQICKLNPGLTSKTTLKIGRKIRVN